MPQESRTIQSLPGRPEMIGLLILFSSLALLLFFYLRQALKSGQVVSMRSYHGAYVFRREDDPYQYWMSMIFLGGFVLPLLVLGAAVTAQQLCFPVDPAHQDASLNISR